MDAYATATTTRYRGDGSPHCLRQGSKERPSIIARVSVSARCTISWSTSPPGELPTPSCLSAASSHGRELSSAALEGTLLRYAPGRVRHRSRPQPARGSAELYGEQHAARVLPGLQQT